MKILFTTFALLATGACFSQTYATGVLQKMYDAHHGTWYKVLTNEQIIERYHKGSVVHVDTAYYTTVFPNSTRIDFVPLAKGNAEINRPDSAFSFRRGRLFRQRKSDNDVMAYLTGGVYFFPFQALTNHMQGLGISLDSFYESIWQGVPVYIIGCANRASKDNQLWIDKQKLVPVRLLIYGDNQQDDYQFTNYIKLGEGWKETLIYYYGNGSLLYKQTLLNCKADRPLHDGFFDAKRFGEWHWAR